MKKSVLHGVLTGVLLLLSAAGTGVCAQKLLPVCHKNGKWGYKYDGSGKWVIKPKYDYAGQFREGLAAVWVENGWYRDRNGQKFASKRRAGYIDEQGTVVIPMIFNMTDGFSEGRARVRIWDWTSYNHFYFGFVDHSGRFVIPCVYHYAENFRDGRALVKWYEDGRYYSCYVDAQGECCSEVEVR